jgi:hypothetical protein
LVVAPFLWLKPVLKKIAANFSPFFCLKLPIFQGVFCYT